MEKYTSLKTQGCLYHKQIHAELMSYNKVQSDVHESMSSSRLYLNLPRTVSNKHCLRHKVKVHLNVKVAENSGAKKLGEQA